MLIRRELPDDAKAIRAVTAAAFRGLAHSMPPAEPGGDPGEAALVAQLRADAGWLPALSLVAVEDGTVLGYVVATRAHLDDRPVLGLGPLSVLPERQGTGIGTALMHAVLGAADALGEPLVGLLGEPAYYRRFGFVHAQPAGVRAPDPGWGDYFQVRTLTQYAGETGTFRYAAPFGPALTLTRPDARLREAWLAAYREWPPGSHQDASGLRDGDDVHSPEGFAAWVAKLLSCADPQTPLPPGQVAHSTYWWITSGAEVLGSVELRHDIDHPLLLEAGGHIGYSVRPGRRGRGIATWALTAALDQARSRGLKRVLLTCSPDNPASAHIIERAGGVLEDVRETPVGPKRRYWITL